MLFKVLSHLVSMSLQKFVILANSHAFTQSFKTSTEIIRSAEKQTTLKRLCKFLQTFLKANENCEHVHVFF
jgi:hypothetical protein